MILPSQRLKIFNVLRELELILALHVRNQNLIDQLKNGVA